MKLKKIISISFFFLVSILLFSCSSNQVDEEQIKADLNERFSEQEFIVDNITIDKARHDEKQSILDITATMTAPNADITRMYRVTYDYYDKGGWILEECEDINTDEWTATPYEFDISTEKMADMIFNDAQDGGHFLSVDGAHFHHWNWTTTTEHSPSDYISAVSYDGEPASGKIIANVTCKANSAVFKIEEIISQEWEFDPKDLEWHLKSSYPQSHSQEILDDISGIYYSTFYAKNHSDYGSEYITISKQNDKLFCTSNDDLWKGLQNAELLLDNIFGGEIHYTDENNKDRMLFWTYYPDSDKILFQYSWARQTYAK